MWYDFSRGDIAVGLEEVTRIWSQFVFDVIEVPYNFSTVGILYGPWVLRLDSGTHCARK